MVLWRRTVDKSSVVDRLLTADKLLNYYQLRSRFTKEQTFPDHRSCVSWPIDEKPPSASSELNTGFV
ncbi:hypothetical protein MGG_16541 [Pyricularia oryzae 70-15]|uniref:Uncharacterized protein n=3 Tax=Pyricularia oryzae TaxID=318829 RepID=G4ML18_PYRO7|nr:uncharacterized protein MGG_16541 [Pyricularia oryzae 70-15]EHA58445.1 hypothetical protein MGG_16541 [Pyricularia oryzae 70-15]ELQ35840.1 hypothetical protein OOU_Y34scaffold00685g18 [Pyricularia oryzae Y34]